MRYSPGMAANSPTFARRQLGLQLQALRDTRGLTADKAAKELSTNATTLRRWETGASGISGPALQLLCHLYGVKADARATLFALMAQGKRSGWWASHAELPSTYRDLIGMESAADESWNYEPQFVPGLLQTEEYARALISASDSTLNDGHTDSRVQARIKRQERLAGDDPIKMRVVLDESVLHRPIGGPEVMAEQLDRLIDLATRPHISIQVLPYRASPYGHAGSFVLLTYPEPAPSVVYVEVLTGVLYQEGPAIDSYRLAHENLRTAAASFEDSLTMLKSARGAMA